MLFRSTSLVPQEAAAVGISYEDLCEQIVEDGLRLRAGSGIWETDDGNIYPSD